MATVAVVTVEVADTNLEAMEVILVAKEEDSAVAMEEETA